MPATLKALAHPRCPEGMKPLLVGCRASLKRTHQRLRNLTGVPLADPDDLDVEDLPIPGRQYGKAIWNSWLYLDS